MSEMSNCALRQTDGRSNGQMDSAVITQCEKSCRVNLLFHEVLGHSFSNSNGLFGFSHEWVTLLPYGGKKYN